MDPRVMAMNEYSYSPKLQDTCWGCGGVFPLCKDAVGVYQQLQLTRNYIKLCDIVSYIVCNGWFLCSTACQLLKGYLKSPYINTSTSTNL